MKVLLAEDSVLLREGLTGLLRALGHEVVAVGDANQLLATVKEQAFDVIVTDVRMPPNMRDDGLLAVSTLRQVNPDQPVVVLSQYVAASYLDCLLQHGGFGYLLKERVSDVEHFVAVLEEVRGGGTVVDSEVVSTLLAAKQDGIAELTPREREVLDLMAQGLSNKEMEKRLVLTAGAVSKHVANVFLKLGFQPEDNNRRVKAVLRWLRYTAPST